MRVFLSIALLAVISLQCCHGKLFDLDLYDEIACSEETRPRILNADPPGLFTTPNFNISAGNLYPPDSLCEWQITQNGPGDLQLKFINFTLEDSEQCKNDYVEIYEDGPDGELIGTYCGQVRPENIVRPSGSTLFVRFVSDNSVEYPGFLARYGEPTLGLACQAERPQVINAQNGTLSSPDWPAEYDNDLDCEWKFEADVGNVWVVNTSFFELENCCGCDNWQVFDGDSEDADRIGLWYGTETLPPPIITSGPDMYVTFVTDISVTYSGFFGIYTQIDANEAESLRKRQQY